MRSVIVILTLCVAVACVVGAVQAQTLQQALNDLGYTVNVSTDAIPGELYFQKQNSNASIVFQESAQSTLEAFGWYSASDTGQWLIGGEQTGLLTQAFLPDIEGVFGFKLHPNYTGTGYLPGVWYTELSRNIDEYRHVRVFPTAFGGQPVPYSYLLCWEDQMELGDADFQDMIVRVDWVQAIQIDNQPGMVHLVPWLVEEGGNGHCYAVMNNGYDWQEARGAAEALEVCGESGHLATITSAEENEFIFDHVIAGLANPNFIDQYFIGGVLDDGQWTWITGEPMAYMNWSPGEPNDSGGTEDRIALWGAYSFPGAPQGGGIPGTWNDEDQDNHTYWSIVEFDNPSTSGGTIAGIVNGPAAPMSGVEVELHDAAFLLVDIAYSNPSGEFVFENLEWGTYSVVAVPPLGFQPETGIVELSVSCSVEEVTLELSEVTLSATQNIWWWKTYIDDLRSNGPREDVFTIDDVNTWCRSIFINYFDRSDGNEIAIRWVTYIGYPPTIMTFSDVVWTLLDEDHTSYESMVRYALLPNLLNVCSGRQSQLEVVTADGATASQAINHFARLYVENANWTTYAQRNRLIAAYEGLRDISMNRMLPSGSVPLTTPNIMYKEPGETPSSTPLLPTSPVLAANYPNPFNPTTAISYSLPQAALTRLEVFNSLGQLVDVLVEGVQSAGEHRVDWHAEGRASGVYLYRLEALGRTETRKMMLLK